MNLDDYIHPVVEEKSIWRQLIEQPLMPPRENADFYLEQARLKAGMKKISEKLRLECNPHAGGAKIKHKAHTVFTIQGVQTGRVQA